MNTEKAIMVKSTRVWMKFPIFNVTASLITFPVAGSLTASFMMILMSVKVMPPTSSPMGGMITSFTTEETIFPNAAPIIIPTARSITLPFIAKSLNSFIMLILSWFFVFGTWCLVLGTGYIFYSSSLTFPPSTAIITIAGFMLSDEATTSMLPWLRGD